MVFRFKERPEKERERERVSWEKIKESMKNSWRDFQSFVQEILIVTQPNSSPFLPGQLARLYFPIPLAGKGAPVTQFSLVEYEWK